MSKREANLRQHSIIRALSHKPSTFRELSEKLLQESKREEYNLTVSQRTFERDRQDILALYGIEILYDFSRRVYYIDNDGQPEASSRLLEMFDTARLLSMAENLSRYVQFEKRKSTGSEHLYGLIHAIKSRFRVNFSYRPFWEEGKQEEKRTVDPLLLKEFKTRWYLMAIDRKDDVLKSFGLDRISELHTTRQKFKYPADFNIESIYRHAFGIVNPEGNPPQEVVLSFTPHQGNYLRTLPLHASQEILEDSENEFRIRIKLCITYDFLMELLSYGDKLVVIKPESLAGQMKTEFTQALNRYM